MSILKLFLFGSPRVELDGTAVEFERRKALALFIYLAVTGQAHSRDTLATLFYPDQTQSQARAYLRRDLAILNGSLAGDWLAADREVVELKRGPELWLDLAEFERLLAACRDHPHPADITCAECLPLLSQAAGLYTGDFLAGFTLRDSPEFDDWQFFETESRRQRLAQVLERLAWGYSQQGEPETALPYGRRWVALDPLHEPAQRLVMQLYDQAGQLAAALRQYEEYVKLLETELGLPPEEETATLYEAIKARRMLGSFIKEEQRSRSGPRPDSHQPKTEPAPDRQAALMSAARQQQAGNYPAAIELLKPLLAADPADEAVHRELMHLYALSGHRHEALRQYQACVQALAARNAAPDAETETRYREIVRGEVTLPSPSVPKPAWLPPAPIAVEVEQSLPLVGREAELETVLHKIQTSRQGQGCTVLLAGEAGVGKTRLAYEALHEAAMARMTTLAGAAYEQEGNLSYQPFTEAFDRYLDEQQRPASEHPITHYKPLEVDDPHQERSALFKATANFLTSLATRAPVVLLIDDLHAADEASLNLFHYLARYTSSAPVILLATYRTEDVAAQPLSPLGSLLNALYRERLCETLHLEPLSETAGAGIVGHILDGPVEPGVVKAVFEIAEGNPFFIQEITRAMQKAGHLHQEEGQWRLRPGSAPQVPLELREWLRERIQRLGPTVEPVLSAASILGREFRFPLLQAVTALPDNDLLDALDAALTGQLLKETEEGYRFSHSLIRQTLYEGLSRLRRSRLHLQAAEAIEAMSAGRPESLKAQAEALAFHYDLSDRRDRAVPYLLQAGEKAAAVYALELANDYLERALAIINDLGLDNPAQRWQILEQLGWLAMVLADTRRAVARFEEALALVPTDDWQPQPGDRLRVHRLAARTLISAGQAAAAEQHLQTAMEAAADAGQASPDYAGLLYDVALWYWHHNEYREALDVARQSLDVAQRLNDVEATAQAYEVLALACHTLGDWQQGLFFEEQRAALAGASLDVTRTFDVHL